MTRNKRQVTPNKIADTQKNNNPDTLYSRKKGVTK